MSDALQRKSILKDGILNIEYTGFLTSFESFGISCILKSTNRSKNVYSLFVYSQSNDFVILPIEKCKSARRRC